MTNQVTANHRRNLRGNTLLESALVLSLALFTILVIVELGIALFIYQGITERARHAARYAVVNVFDEDTVKNIAVYGNPTGQGSPLLGLAKNLVTVTVEPIDNQNSVVRVVLQRTPYQFITPFLGISSLLPTIEVTLPLEGAGATT